MLVTVLAGCRTYDARLYGTWESDADRSIARLSKRHDLPKDKQESWRDIFGKMIITFNKTSVTSQLRGETETLPYRVLGKDSDSVAIQFYNSLFDEQDITIIHFEDDGYWILSSVGEIWEFFRKHEEETSQP